MKRYRKIKIETIVLILATLFLGSRELMHPFFHARNAEAACCYRICIDNDSKNSFWENSGKHGDEKFSSDHVCPLCSSLSSKYTSLLPAVYSLPGNESINSSFIRPSILLEFRLEEASRGPPQS